MDTKRYPANKNGGKKSFGRKREKGGGVSRKKDYGGGGDGKEAKRGLSLGGWKKKCGRGCFWGEPSAECQEARTGPSQGPA